MDKVSEELDEIWKLVKKAQYERAFQKAFKLYRRFPTDHRVLYQYAICLGDRTGEDISAAARRNHMKAAHLLKSLIHKKRSFDSLQRINVLNEYYWFSKQPRQQYKLGLKSVEQGVQAGWYSMGVGAWQMAKRYIRLKKNAYALRWARRAANAWNAYIKCNPTYYNAWVWYASVQGFLHGKTEMESALKRAQELSGRSKDYIEFENVRIEFFSKKYR